MKCKRFAVGKTHEMLFSRSITFDDEELGRVAVAAKVSSAFPTAEKQFIEKLRSGDGEAFDLLISRYSNDVYSLLCRLTEDPEEAGDLTQETFLSALKAVRSFRGESELKTWLFRIAINHSRNRFRWWKRRHRNETVSLEDSRTEDGITVGEKLKSAVADPEVSILSRERENSICRALSELPEAFREVIVLCDIEGRAYDEIASLLMLNIGTVKSRIARGRELMRRKLSDF